MIIPNQRLARLFLPPWRKVAAGAALLGAVLLLPAAALPETMAPLWIRLPPAKPGWIYGVGSSAIVANQTAALENAGHAARFDLLSRMRSSVRGSSASQTIMLSQTSPGQKESASRFQHAEAKNRVEIADVTISGLEVVETYLDEKHRTAYALASLDTTVAREGCELAYQRLAKAGQDLTAAPPANAFAAHVALRRLLDQADELLAALAMLNPFIQCGPLCDDALALRQQLAAAHESARQRATFGLEPGSPVPMEIARIIRASLEKMGYPWDDAVPAMQVTARMTISEEKSDIANRSVSGRQSSLPFYGRRLSATFTIRDAANLPCDSFSLETKGIGINPASALQDLEKNFAEELGNALLESEKRMLAHSPQ